MNAQQIRPSSPPVSGAANQYYVFSADNNHVGPVTADLIGRGVVAGKVPNDAFVAPLGSTNWVPLASIPELNLAVSAARVQHHSSIRPVSMPENAIAPFVLTGPPPPPQDLANFLAPPPLSVSPQPEAPPAASVAPPAKAEEKKEEKKPALDPRMKLLPLAIFGAFAFLGVIETVIATFVVK